MVQYSPRDNTLTLSPDSSVADILRTGQASASDTRRELSGFNGDESNFDPRIISSRPLQNRRNSKASRSQEALDLNCEINDVHALSQLQSFDDHAGQQTTCVTGLT